MTDLATGEVVALASGEWYLVTNSVLGTGTAVFSMSIDGKPYQDIADASFTGDGGVIFDMPGGNLKVTLTGDSTALFYPKLN